MNRESDNSPAKHPAMSFFSAIARAADRNNGPEKLRSCFFSLAIVASNVMTGLLAINGPEQNDSANKSE
jgi:hypothetical protein